MTSSFSRVRMNGSLAGATTPEWKAAETGTSIPSRPRDLKSSPAFMTAAVSPDITVCLGEFLFAATTYPSISASASSTRRASAGILIIRPGSAMLTLAISRPLTATASRASLKEKTPAATHAAYSPNECPAQATGFTPIVSRSLSMAVSAVRIIGCKVWVSLKGSEASAPILFNAASSGNNMETIEGRPSDCNISSASPKVSATTGYRSHRSLNMKVYCDP